MLASVEYAFSLGSRYGRPCDSRNAHLRPSAELVDEGGVEPRLVDAQLRVDQQAVAVEALDVVALVGAAVAPDVDAVGVHRLDEQRAGHRPTERGRVEVRLAGRGDVEGAALQRHQALADELRAAVDEARLLGTLRRPLRDARQIGSSYCPRSAVYRVGRRLRRASTRPPRGVEAAGEGDADALAHGQRQQGWDGSPRSRRAEQRLVGVTLR